MKLPEEIADLLKAQEKEINKLREQNTNLKFQVETHDFWKDIVVRGKNTLNIAQVKRELHDFRFIINQIPQIYMAVTGGLLSKCTYPASTVISCFEDYLSKCVGETTEMLEQEISNLRAENADLRKALK